MTLWADCVSLLHASLLSLFSTCVVKLDQLLNISSKGVTPQEESAQSLVLTPGSRLTITKAEKVFSRLRVEFTYDGTPRASKMFQLSAGQKTQQKTV